MAKQLAFDFSIPPAPTFDNFVNGGNVELVQRLRELSTARPEERFVYLWGPPASGRSHLMHAALGRLQHSGLRVKYVAGEMSEVDCAPLSALDAIAVDDVQRLDAAQQIALFNVYNELREQGKTLLAAGNVAPMQLALRADLVTRFGWGLVYEVHQLTDADKSEALAEHAAARGFALQPEVCQYLLRRVRRDMPTLLAMLDALDRYSLETKRPVTVPLVREMVAGTAE